MHGIATEQPRIVFGGNALKMKSVGTGLHRAYPDLRDYTEWSNSVHQLLRTDVNLRGIQEIGSSKVPTSVDFRPDASPIRDQGLRGSCTAFAVSGILEYMIYRAFGERFDASEIFLYNATKHLLGWEGDSGAYLRSTMKALRVFGVSPEDLWEYDEVEIDQDPNPYAISAARNYNDINYFRHDADESLNPICHAFSIKKYLAAGIPSALGFYGYSDFNEGNNPGEIPIPNPEASVRWAHAVGVFGYDDEKEIYHPTIGKTTQGAFIIRNSWGTDWGQDGYGWMPYEYFIQRIRNCWDIWSILSAEFIETGEFGL